MGRDICIKLGFAVNYFIYLWVTKIMDNEPSFFFLFRVMYNSNK